MEDLNVKYVPVDMYCVWVRDIIGDNISMLGYVPRKLEEEDLDLPAWVYSESNIYGDFKRLYEVHVTTLNDFILAYAISKGVNASFGIAGLEIF